MDDDGAVATLEGQQKRIQRELKKCRQAATRAQKEEEEHQLIAAGEGPRRAKEKALKEAGWYQVEGKKRPRSPSADDSAHNDDSVQVQPDKASRPSRACAPKRLLIGFFLTDFAEKRRKGAQQREEKDSEGDTIEKVKKRGQGVNVDSTVTRRCSNGTVKANARTYKGRRQPGPPTKTRAPSVASDSLSLLDPDDELDKLGEGSMGEDDADEEEDLDVISMTEKEARMLLDDEVPRDAAHLFDDDDGVEMVSVRSEHSRRTSSEASRPPTSESEGLSRFDDQEDSSWEEELEAPAVSRRRKQAKKRPSKRDAVLTMERPAIVTSRAANNASTSRSRPSSKVCVESDQENDVSPEEKWPAQVRLNINAGLLGQNVHLHTICREAIKIVEKTLVTEHAWPELHRAAVYKRQVLLEAIKPLVGKDKLYKDVQKRITQDDDFVRFIGKWVIDRLSHHRGTVRSVASDHIALFQLGINEGCKDRVKALMENDVYVFPGEWGVTDKGKPVWLTKSSSTDIQIYLNPGLIQVIQDAFFATPTSFGYKFKDQFVSSHPSQPEPELTIPIVALSATAFFAAIWEWREGKRLVKAKTDSKSSERFDGDLFKTVFDRHVETLTGLQKKVNTYHSIMSKLYLQVTVNDTAANFSTRIQGNALAILDLSGLD